MSINDLEIICNNEILRNNNYLISNLCNKVKNTISLKNIHDQHRPTKVLKTSHKNSHMS